MINYSANQRRSVKWDGNNWIEEVLTDSGVAVDSSAFTTITGNTVHEVFEVIDNTLEGIEYSVGSGIVFIEEVANVSGVTSSSIGTLDSIVMPSGASNSAFKFSFGVPLQPVDPVQLRVMYSPLQAVSGNIELQLEYSIFDQSDVLTASGYISSATPATAVISASDQNALKMLNFTLPVLSFSVSGSAPYLVAAKVTRNAAVAGNYAGNLAVVKVYADNVPGAVTGNTAGYVGGNLDVTGNMTVEGIPVFEYNTVPAANNSTGTSGSLILGEHFIYVATATNTWKRTAINDF